MTVDDVINRHVEAVREVSDVLETAFGAGVTSGGLLALLRHVRTDGGAREGQLSSGVRYLVHGAGARFTLADDRLVDVDNDESATTAMWDGWRLADFADSIGVDVEPDEAARHLQAYVAAGRLRELRPGWFTLSE